MHRFTTATETEAVRSALDELQQAGAALQELCIRFCESLNDSFVQQLLSQPMSALQRSTYELMDAQYSAREVRLIICCCTCPCGTWSSVLLAVML